MRSRITAFLLLVSVSALAPLASASPAPLWSRPVAGPVARPFRAPLTRFGAGHLGVDFSVPPGTPVRAAGAGTVVFAGVVAGARHVVISHPGGLRTSYSFLASIRVRKGEVVRRGAVLGTSGGRGENHEPDVLHFGLRIGATFVDPMQLFAEPDLVLRVHLAPIGDPEPTGPGPDQDGPRPPPVVLAAAVRLCVRPG